MAQGRQLRNQRLVVVDLSIEDHDNRAVLVEQRLLPRGQVDDRKAPVPKTDTWLDVNASLVRSAVVLRLIHPMQDRAINLRACPACRKCR
jgi:hypothetical protein